MMRAGRLRHRVDIRKNYPTRDSYGNKTNAWRTIATRWAAIEPIKATERMSANQMQMEVTHRVTVRFIDELQPMDRVRAHPGSINSRELEIMSIINREERDVSLELLCKEAV